jgi:tetratricopeptide (TPR) repeat protein
LLAVAALLLVPLLLRAAEPMKLKPEDLVKQAIAFEQEGKWQEARVNCLMALEQNPKFGEALFRLGKLYLVHDSAIEAVARLESAKVCRYDGFEVDRWLALANFKTGRYAPAIELYVSAIERKPKQADLREELARVYLANDNLEEAHNQDSIAMQLDRKNVNAQMTHGRIHTRGHEFALAREAYRELLSADPEYAPPYEALAELLKSSMVDSAIFFYRQYLLLAPDDANANFSLSGLFYNQSQRDTIPNRSGSGHVPSGKDTTFLPLPANPSDTVAVKRYKFQKDSLTLVRRAAHSESAFVYVGNAIRLGFGREDVYDFYINVAQAARKRTASITALKAFIDKNPRDAQKWALLGQVQADSAVAGGGAIDTAMMRQSIGSYKEAAALDSMMRRRSFSWIAQQYYKEKQYDSAIVYYNKVIEGDTIRIRSGSGHVPSGSVYINRAYAFIFGKSDKPRGIADIRKAISIEPKRIDWRVFLMKLCYGDKVFDAAYDEAKSILEIDGSNEDAKTVKKNIEIMRAPKPNPEEE